VKAVDVANRTIYFEQKATAGGGRFWWLEGNLPELWPGPPSSRGSLRSLSSSNSSDNAGGEGSLVPTGPVCTQTTAADVPCTPSRLPWMLVEVRKQFCGNDPFRLQLAL
jgi:hypothetical protein